VITLADARKYRKQSHLKENMYTSELKQITHYHFLHDKTLKRKETVENYDTSN
jgi:hypothetical protein